MAEKGCEERSKRYGERLYVRTSGPLGDHAEDLACRGVAGCCASGCVEMTQVEGGGAEQEEL